MLMFMHSAASFHLKFAALPFHITLAARDFCTMIVDKEAARLNYGIMLFPFVIKS